MKRIGILVALFTLGLIAAHGQQTGLVVQVNDPAGRPIERAAVILESSAGFEEISKETNSAGVARFQVRQGVYRLTVHADGFELFELATVSVAASPVKIEAELELSPVQTAIQVIEAPPAPIAAERRQPDDLEVSLTGDLAEKLKAVPGVLAIRRGATNLDPVVQGLREYQLAMVVDGTRTFAAGPARMDSELSHVASGFVDELEVVKGPYALTAGSGALSAVVVRTAQVPYSDDWSFGGILSGGYSTNGTDRFARASVFGANRRFGFRLRGVGDKGNNYSVGERGGIRQSVPARYSHHQFGGKVRLNVTDSQELLFDGAYDEQTNIDYPGRLLNAVHFITRSWNGGYYIKAPSASVESVRFGLFLAKKSHRMTNDGKPTARDMPGRIPPFALDVSLPTESDTWGGSGAVVLRPRSGWRLQTGFDFYNLHQDAKRFISRRSNGRLLFEDNAWPDATINNQGFYFQATRSYDAGEISGGVRLDLVQADAMRPSQFFLENTVGDLNQNEVNGSFNVAGRRRLWRGLMLAGGFGRAVRTANVLERYSDRFPSTKFQIAAEFMGAPELKPETSYQGDISLEYTIDRLTVLGGAFYRRIDNIITVAPDPDLPKRLPLSPPIVFRYLSGDHANYRGVDFGLRLRLKPWAELISQGSHVLGDDIEQNTPGIERNEPLLGMPPSQIASKLRFASAGDRFWGELGLRNVWSQNRVAASRLETRTPGFSTCFLRAGAELPLQFTLMAGFENLGDKFYSEHVNSLNPFTRQRVPERGRSVFFALNKVF